MPSLLHFSGASDDLLHLSTGGTAAVTILDKDTQSHQLDEISALRFSGWLVTPADGPPFAVRAYLTNPSFWVFAPGFPPGADVDDGADIGYVAARFRQSPLCPYSVELTVELPGPCTVEAIPGRAAGA